MKKLPLLILFIGCFSTTNAQESPVLSESKTEFKNELGIDVTGLLMQFLTISTEYTQPYQPLYFFSYRRKFGRSNLRLGLGGNFRYIPRDRYSDEDPKELLYQSYSVGLRVGYEHTSEVGKRWQLFYGVDFRPSYVYEKDDANYANGQVIYGRENQAAVFGLAPILGVRFRITDRICLITETNFSVNFIKSFEQEILLPRYFDSPIPEQPERIERFGVSGSYTQPLSLILTFDI